MSDAPWSMIVLSATVLLTAFGAGVSFVVAGILETRRYLDIAVMWIIFGIFLIVMSLGITAAALGY